MIVVLPDPFGPRRPVIEPFLIESETSFTARPDFEEYDFEKLLSSIINLRTVFQYAFCLLKVLSEAILHGLHPRAFEVPCLYNEGYSE